MDTNTIDKEVAKRNLKAARVTAQDLEANIKYTEIVEHTSKSGQVLRWALLTAQNGFTVTGKPSVSVSPENDNQEIGEHIAIDNAKKELWALMGYELKSKLYNKET